MITYLKGKLTAKTPPFLIIENGQVGYTLQASMQTFYQLPEVGEEILLHTLLFLKEDMPWLYGFIQPDERQLFRELLKVNTIGPKAALAILSNINIQQLYQTVTHQNLNTLQRIPGIGKKTAERLLLELTNRLKHWQPIDRPSQTDESANNKQTMVSEGIIQDSIDALIALGYKSSISATVIHRLFEPSSTRENLIRRALHQLTQA